MKHIQTFDDFLNESYPFPQNTKGLSGIAYGDHNEQGRLEWSGSTFISEFGRLTSKNAIAIKDYDEHDPYSGEEYPLRKALDELKSVKMIEIFYFDAPVDNFDSALDFNVPSGAQYEYQMMLPSGVVIIAYGKKIF